MTVVNSRARSAQVPIKKSAFVRPVSWLTHAPRDMRGLQNATITGTSVRPEPGASAPAGRKQAGIRRGSGGNKDRNRGWGDRIDLLVEIVQASPGQRPVGHRAGLPGEVAFGETVSVQRAEQVQIAQGNRRAAHESREDDRLCRQREVAAPCLPKP